jgi:hypothetical protein
LFVYLWHIGSCSNSQTEQEKSDKEQEKSKRNVTKRDEGITVPILTAIFWTTKQNFISEKKLRFAGNRMLAL